MDVTRLKIEGADELEAQLLDLGTDFATKIGVAAVRSASNELKDRLVEAAPLGPGKSKYGHLRDNIKTRRLRARVETAIPFLVSTGKAFWANFLELGTVKMRPHPWFRPVIDSLWQHLLAVMVSGLDTGIARRIRINARKKG